MSPNVGTASVGEWLDAAHERIQFMEGQQKLLQEERERYEQEAGRLEGLLERNRQAMVGHLLPELQDAALARLERRLQYGGGLLPHKRAAEEQLAQVEQERQSIEAQDDWQNLEHYLGQAETELAELKESYESFRAEVALWEADVWFQRLRDRGYFQANYRPRGLFQRLGDWRAVSFLMARLERKQRRKYRDPDALRSSYDTLTTEAVPVFVAYEDLEKRRAGLLALQARHAALVARPAELMQELYAALGDALRRHLEACPEELRLSLAAGDADFATYLNKDVGLQKQAQYLRELVAQRIQGPLEELQQQTARLRRKADKTRYKRSRGKWVVFSQADVASLRDLKAERWEKRHRKLTVMRERIGGFDRWDRGSFADDFLWWDLVTRGAPGHDIYEVRVFHEHHPGWSWRSYDRPWHHDHYHDAALSMAADDLADDMQAGADAALFTDAS